MIGDVMDVMESLEILWELNTPNTAHRSCSIMQTTISPAAPFCFHTDGGGSGRPAKHRVIIMSVARRGWPVGDGCFCFVLIIRRH